MWSGSRNTNIEPKAPSGRPKCPDWLDNEAQAAWEWLVPKLEQLGVLTTVDYPALVTRANETAERLLRESRVKRAALEPLEAIVGAFCVGLAREPYLVDRYLPPLN